MPKGMSGHPSRAGPITLHTLSLACPHLRTSSTPGSCISAISTTAPTFSFPGTVCPCAVDSRQWKARTPWHPDAGTKATSGSPTLGARGANCCFAGDLGTSQSQAGVSKQITCKVPGGSKCRIKGTATVISIWDGTIPLLFNSCGWEGSFKEGFERAEGWDLLW